MTWEEAKHKGVEGRLELLLNGQSPVLLTKMPGGFAAMGDFQHLPGYCVLLAYPIVFSIDTLSLEQRLEFLRDMMLLGQAVSEVCQPLRMNYSILGNGEPFLHAHVRPRYVWETEKYRRGPYDRYPDEEKYHPKVRPHGLPHSLYEELWHIHYWLQFSLADIRGEQPKLPAHSSEAFPTNNATLDETTWQNLVDEVLENLNTVATLARDEVELARVFRSERTVRDELTIIAAHNAYHLGRMVMLRQLLGIWSSELGDTW